MVTLPGVDGEMGIYPNHVPLMTQLTSGEVVVRKNNQDMFLAVGEGFVEITGDRVAILTDMAIRAENIDEAQANKPANAPKLVWLNTLTTKNTRPYPLRWHIPSRN